MTILAIETSCDDTCIAIIETDRRRYQRRKTQIKFNLLSNVVSSQVKLHAKYGGVYPSLAKREHQKNLIPVLKQALKGVGKIDLIAVTNGPGLEPCLWVGVNFAKALASAWDIPLIPVNHIEAHILVNWLSPVNEIKSQKLKIKSLFPAICLVVSGGHTQLILMNDFGKYKIIGETRDDAAGECFDKTARILGLPYPGGPAIAAEAAKPIANRQSLIAKLPRPMLHQKNYDFSFSGLKTAVLYHYKKQPKKVHPVIRPGAPSNDGANSPQYIQVMAKEIQQAIIDVLIKKTIRAAKEFKVKAVILGGGVTANKELRKQLQEKLAKELPNTQYLIPERKFSTDNAAMVGVTGYFGKPKPLDTIKAQANLRIK